MNSFTSHRVRLCGAVVFAALTASGLFTSAAQAQPRGNVPLPGWPTNQNPNWNERDGRRGNDPWNERQVMSGEVVRRYSNTEYDLRAGDGHVFRVRSDDSITLDRGDEVRIGGDWRGSTFYATTITLVDRDNGFGNWGDRGDWNNGNFRNRINLTGTVAQRFGTQSFEIRTSTGRVYLVRGDNRTPNLRSGDRVRVDGYVDGNRVRATGVSNLSRNGGFVDDGPWNRTYPNSQSPRPGGWGTGGVNGGYAGNRRPDVDAGIGLDVDFPGRVESIDRFRREATVRGENGRTYRVRASQDELTDYRVGDRIRVRGVVRDDYITADDLSRIR